MVIDQFFFSFENSPTGDRWGGKEWPAEDLKFHCNWNWLMPVVEKIENTEVNNVFYEVLIGDRWCSIRLRNEQDHFFVSTESRECSSKIEAVWQTNVKFIKQTDYV